MRSFLSRAAALAATMLMVLPTTAGAAEVDEYAAEASTTAVLLSAFEAQVGSPILDLVGTEASAASDPVASAAVEAVEVLGTAVGEPRTASSESGDESRAPESGDGCELPVDTTGLTLEAVCTVATATAAPLASIDQLQANATTQLTDVDVDGSLLAGALTEPLGDFVVTAGDLLVEGAVDQFIEQCNEVIATIDEQAQVTQTAGDLLGMAPEELQPITDQVSETVGEADQDGFCAAVVNLTTQDLSEEVLDVGPIADALAGQDLVSISVDGAVSDVTGNASDIVASGNQVLVTITGPSLDFLDDVIVTLVDAIVAEIEAIAGVEAPEELDVQPALDAIPLFGITGPLLEASISGGSATGTLTLDDGGAVAGGEQPFVSVSIAPGIIELLGGDPEMGTVELSAGESETLAADTPAESSISVGELTVDEDATFEDSDLTGARSTASATEVTLLSGVEGGIVLTLAESSAGVFSAELAEPAPAPDPLPNTGGGAAMMAVLALGAAVALRRRTD